MIIILHFYFADATSQVDVLVIVVGSVVGAVIIVLILIVLLVTVALLCKIRTVKKRLVQQHP